MNRSGSLALFDSDDSDLDDIVKKNLMPYLDEQSVKAEREYVKVFLRIRPFTRTEEEKDENQGCIEVENEQSVIVQAPKESNAHRSAQYGLAKQAQMFTFSKVFGDNTSQKTFFDETMLSTVKDFINGENCLVFSYGVTNSGKTYTIQGDPKDSGLLPRSLDVVFNSIDSRIYDRMDLKPSMYCDVVRLSLEQERSEIALKESIMKMTFDDKDFCPVADVTESLQTTSDDLSNHPENDGTIDEISTAIANRRREEATIDVRSQGHIRFSVWISFVEIYNEQIFDLLVPVSRKKTERRPILNLREDKNGNPYVKDLRQINVSSADEAYRLLALGRRNLRMACTKLNQSSSRSHCIFSIKMIRVVDKDQPHYARISMLSLCDLAGSERHHKTDSIGDRLKEAGNINTSLLTLGRCITALRNKQNNRNTACQQVVPFRDSKLTRLFYSYLTGKGRASMIVNINQCASIFDETLNCLRYSAIAKQVIVRESLPVPKPVAREMRSSNVPLLKVPPLKPPTALSRATVGWASPGTYQKMIEAGEISVSIDRLSSTTEGDETINGSDEEEECHTMTERDPRRAGEDPVKVLRAEWSRDRAILLGVIRQLKEKLEAEINAKDALEVKIRGEVCEEMKAQLVIIENNYQESLRLREEINEEKLERKLEILSEAMQKSKKRRLDNEDEEYVQKHLLDAEISKVQKHSHRIEELEDEVDSLRRELTEVKTSFSQVSKERESFAQETTKAQFFASDAKQKLDDMENKLNESEALVVDLNKQVHSLTEVCETQRLSLNNLTSVNQNLEARNKLMESRLEDCQKRLTFIDELSGKHKVNYEMTNFKYQLEVKDATVSKLSTSSFCKKSHLANGQQPTCVASGDADDKADVSQMEFESIANQNLKDVVCSSLDGTRLRSVHRKSRQPRATDNVDPVQSMEQDKASDILQNNNGNMSSVMKSQSRGDRSPTFKSPSRSLNLSKRRRRVLGNVDEQLTTSLAEDNCQEVTAQIRKLRSRKP